MTIRFETETLKAMFASKIEASELPTAEKSKLKEHLDTLSKESLSEASKFLIQQGLESLPNAVSWLGTLLGRAG